MFDSYLMTLTRTKSENGAQNFPLSLEKVILEGAISECYCTSLIFVVRSGNRYWLDHLGRGRALGSVGLR